MGAKTVAWPRNADGTSGSTPIVSDTRTLAEAQAEAQSRAQDYFTALMAAGRNVTILGNQYTLALDAVSQAHYIAEVATANDVINGTPGVPAWDAADYWLALDGVTHVPMASAQTAQSAGYNVRTFVKECIKNVSAQCLAIASLTTNDACDTYDVTHGYPSNP